MSTKTREKLQISKAIGTLAIDLGNTTTVVAFQGEQDKYPSMLNLPPLTRVKGEIPSLVWYSEKTSPNLLIGNQILALELAQHNNKSLCKDFKRWIAKPTPEARMDCTLSADQAGEFLLKEIWNCLPKNIEVRRLVLTTPVESDRSYRAWLNQVCSALPVKEIAVVDEPTAAALGAGMPPGSKLLVCDFGGSTIDISLVALEGGEGKASPIAELMRFNGIDLYEQSRQTLRKAKVLGKSGIRLGGRDFDHWIANHLYPQSRLTDELLNAAERLKCRLSNQNLKKSELLTEFVISKGSKEKQILKLNINELNQLLIKRHLLSTLDNLLEETLAGGRSNGCKLEDIHGVIAVGGGSRVLLLKEWLKQKTKPIPLITPPPVEAVAIGAIELTPGVQVRDVLQRGISLRCWEQRSEKHFWHPLFLKGQPWPTSKDLEIILAASHKNQKDLEIVLGEPEYKNSHEVIYVDGMPTLSPVTEEPRISALPEESIHIVLDPPGQPGEDCLKLQFGINSQAKLKIEGEDLRTGKKIEVKLISTVR